MMNVSHGPYIIASVLPQILAEKNDQELSQLQMVSAGGFRDTTRVSNSAIEWGLDILKEIRQMQLRLFIKSLNHWKV